MFSRSIAVLSAFHGSFLLAAPALAQGIPVRPEAPVDELPGRLPVIIEGVLFQPDGSPAAGAVVVSSAGGQAVTELDGTYRLELGLPLAAELVQLTAVGSDEGDNLVASASAVPLAAPAVTRVGPLWLQGTTSCQPRWLPGFGGQPGMDGSVLALAVFDDGRGPALYAGGAFGNAGGVHVNHIARWNGSNWTALGGGVTADSSGASVWSLAVFDDGSGPALYAAGRFSTAGGLAANRIARWNGSSWSRLGNGLTGPDPIAFALSVYDDGSGPALYIGGNFTTVDGVAANRIAKWDGASWSALAEGLSGFSDDAVDALAVYDDGSGPALYAGGTYYGIGGNGLRFIARWDGTSWSALGEGTDVFVHAMLPFDDGSGEKLHVGGYFTNAGGVKANRIAAWDGASWSALSKGTNGPIRALAVFDDGSGAALYAGGIFDTAGGISSPGLARWDGASWSAVPGAHTPFSAFRSSTTAADQPSTRAAIPSGAGTERAGRG